MARFFAWTFLLLILVSIAASEFSLEGQEQLTKKIQKGKYGPGSLKSFQCPNACGRRCSQTQYHKPCMFFCQKCCRKCLCVPPGFYGNKQVCACYNNWKTKRGGPKCP
ncbi:gibberellin-regulated protein 6-like protein [Cinnamomum micranthum f. kanehirae]|uniref:Gibberellin-regulated protein 6-like protein n=1 Tax=Cinnamomum micranthum f. kanehirae TaxID=337451 RepID=A0A3S3PYE3_9MAGN|nr:gibberellin-regulated protein 6-like protein [Cinnamomum micranthum f. kanehirae]